jgi:hypothetical protein
MVVLHCLPDELLAHVERWVDTGGFFVAVIGIGNALDAVQVRTVAELRARIAQAGLPFRICLARAPLNLALSKLHHVMSQNEIECVVDLGALTDKGLKESHVSIQAEAEGSRFWVAAFRELKREAPTGVWAVNAESGERGYSRDHRYTPGAARYFQSGGALLASGGNTFFEIGDAQGRMLCPDRIHLQKVLFHIESDASGYPPVYAEGVWSIPAGDGLFVLDRIPLFTREATLGDTVEVRLADRRWWFHKLVRKSGNSLLRIKSFKGMKPEEVISALARLRCSTTYEAEITRGLVAVNVPGDVPLRPVRQFLAAAAAKDLLDYEEPILRQD